MHSAVVGQSVTSISIMSMVVNCGCSILLYPCFILFYVLLALYNKLLIIIMGFFFPVVLSIFFFVYFEVTFFQPHTAQHMGSQFPDQALNLHTLHLKHRLLTIDRPEKFLRPLLISYIFITVYLSVKMSLFCYVQFFLDYIAYMLQMNLL